MARELEGQFQTIKEEICKASVAAIEDEIPFTIETDTSNIAITTTLSQNGRLVAFFSQTLTQPERSHSAVDRESAAIMESVRKSFFFSISETVGASRLFVKAKMDCLMPVIWRRFLNFYSDASNVYVLS